nr:hypothetical protein [Bacteroidota bacterium]
MTKVPYNSNNKPKKTIKLNVDAFNGHSTVYNPAVAIYDYNKVGNGIWDFKVKFPAVKDEKAKGYFEGVYRNGFIDFLSYYGFRKRERTDGSYFLLRCIDNTIEEVEIINISDFVTEYFEKNGKDILFDVNLDGHAVKFKASLLLQKETIKGSVTVCSTKSF